MNESGGVSGQNCKPAHYLGSVIIFYEWVYTEKQKFKSSCPAAHVQHILFLFSSGLQTLFLDGTVSPSVAACHAVIQQLPIILDFCINFINQPPLLMAWPCVQWWVGECSGTLVRFHVSLSWCLQLVRQGCTFFFPRRNLVS